MIWLTGRWGREVIKLPHEDPDYRSAVCECVCFRGGDEHQRACSAFSYDRPKKYFCSCHNRIKNQIYSIETTRPIKILNPISSCHHHCGCHRKQRCIQTNKQSLSCQPHRSCSREKCSKCGRKMSSTQYNQSALVRGGGEVVNLRNESGFRQNWNKRIHSFESGEPWKWNKRIQCFESYFEPKLQAKSCLNSKIFSHFAREFSISNHLARIINNTLSKHSTHSIMINTSSKMNLTQHNHINTAQCHQHIKHINTSRHQHIKHIKHINTSTHQHQTHQTHQHSLFCFFPLNVLLIVPWSVI